MLRNLVIATAFFFLFVATGFGADEFKVKQSGLSPATASYVPGEIIVKFKKNVNPQQAQSSTAKLGATVKSINNQIGFNLMSIPATNSVEEMVAAFKNLPEVEYAEPNYIFQAFMTPNDPFYVYQWHMPMINMGTAWDQSTGTGVVVAVIDGGVAYENFGAFAQAPDLAGTSFVPGWDFVNNDSHPNDDNAHGTHVAGTIAQTTNNNLGVTGMAFNCSIMPVKVLNSAGSGSLSNVANGIIFAADNGAKVINMSLGASVGATTLQNAVVYADGLGVTIVCAAGNAGTSAPQYPAAYSQCISVSAVRYDETLAYYSSYGSTIDICAPGGDVTIDQNGDGYVDGVLQQTHDGVNFSTFSYYFYQGTSMASPHVAGLAAMLIAKAGGSLTPAQVRTAIQNTAKDLGSAGWDNQYGYGLIDANAALLSLSPPAAPVANFSGSPLSGTAPLTVNFSDLSTGSISSWSWTFGDGGTSTAQNPSYQYTVAGTYSVGLTVTGPGGSNNNTKVNYITVNPCVLPTAGFVGSPTSGDYPLNVNFTNQSTGGTSWSWNFGDGGASTVQNPSYVYTAAGTFTVTLTATNACGSDQMVRTNYITVTTPPCNIPVAEFVGSPTSGTYPLSVNFTDLSTNSPTSWSWNFGDATTSTAQNPSHSYTSAGTYTVSLTATNSCGSDGETKTGYITVSEPTSDYASLPYSTGFESGSFDQYWFTQSNNSEGRILITSSSTPRGSFHLTMDDNTNGGLYAQNEGWLRLNLAGQSQVELSFWWKEFGDENHTQDGVFLSDNGGSSFSKVYDLVNGTTTYQQIVLDLDQLASNAGLGMTGTFVVKFQQYDNYSIATDGFAFDDISVVSMDVPPVAEFSGTPTSGSAPLLVNFNDLSSGNPTSWSWTFGVGGSSTAQNPQYTYNDPGSYTVSLTATNAFGSDNETKTGYITVTAPSAWTVITFDDFEAGWGSYTDGGSDCSRYTGGTNAWQGTAAADIQDNSGVSSSFYHTAGHNVTAYNFLEVEFYFVAVSMENGEDFWVQYFDGSSWNTVAAYARGVHFNNNTFYVATVSWNSSQFNFPSNAKLRFMCDASGNSDDIYIDAITWRGSATGGAASFSVAPIATLAENGITDDELLVPEEFDVGQNYPNPFNPSTEISFSLPEAAHVTVDVFNILGQRVNTLLDETVQAGVKTMTWNSTDESGNPVSSGIYFYRVLVDGRNPVTKKMMLLR